MYLFCSFFVPLESHPTIRVIFFVSYVSFGYIADQFFSNSEDFANDRVFEGTTLKTKLFKSRWTNVIILNKLARIDAFTLLNCIKTIRNHKFHSYFDALFSIQWESVFFHISIDTRCKFLVKLGTIGKSLTTIRTGFSIVSTGCFNQSPAVFGQLTARWGLNDDWITYSKLFILNYITNEFQLVHLCTLLRGESDKPNT